MDTITDKATEIAETLRNKVTDVLPLNNPQVSKLFACVAPAEEEEFADDDDSMYSGPNNNNQENTNNKNSTFATMDEQMRRVVSTTFNKKFRCNGEDDADTKLSENDNGSSYYDDYSANRTVGLNTVDERNNVNGSRILSANNNTTNRTYKQSFKDKYVQMKKSQQFSVAESDKPSLSINAMQAAKDYDNAKIEKQRRAQLAEQKAQEVLENAALQTGDPRSPSMAIRAPIDP